MFRSAWDKKLYAREREREREKWCGVVCLRERWRDKVMREAHRQTSGTESDTHMPSISISRHDSFRSAIQQPSAYFTAATPHKRVSASFDTLSNRRVSQ
mmetsp:Transcript_22927/g.65589  ORF Transcript_22927/g.65589 Transcript_22927/m.65589 type:complete len:99 (-) Transcript_22927:212-508(-)